jgi:hypothetical protein
MRLIMNQQGRRAAAAIAVAVVADEEMGFTLLSDVTALGG